MMQNTFVQIRCRSGSLAGQTYCFIEPGLLPLPMPLRMGRHHDADIRFSGETELMVSRLHAELHYERGVLSLRDAGSTYGTYIVPSQEKIERLNIAQGSSLDVQLGANGPICNISLGGAIPFGPYMLTSKLGEGGMGEVYIGCDTRLNRQVVLKLLHPSLLSQQADFGKVLLNEARIVSQLEHPNIVRVYEIGDQSGILYLAMEYIRGITLGELRRVMSALGVRLPPPLVAGILRQACLGLHAAHQLPIQVVHRDISLNNLMITPESVKVIDFGLARAKNRVGASFTEGGRVAGCPPYMSPEQIRTPQQIDRRSDIFSLGTVLYQLCSDVSPFSRDTMAATLSAVLMHVPPPLRSLCPDASVSLDRLVQSMLCKEPDRRPATAAELAVLLREESGAEFAIYENIVSYLRKVGVDLQGPLPLPLVTEPALLRRGPVRKPEGARVASVPFSPSELIGRKIDDGKYCLRKPLRLGSRQLEYGLWQQSFLADATDAREGSGCVVVTLCGSNEPPHALPERAALRLREYIAHRHSREQIDSLPRIQSHGAAWPNGPIYLGFSYHHTRLSRVQGVTLSPKEALSIVIQIARALRAECQWQAGYAHGDIHPENIAVCSEEAPFKVMLLDFSLSAVLEHAAVPSQESKRSAYLAPERWEGGAATPAADVFALGMLLYELCGGNVTAATRCLESDTGLPSLPPLAQSSLQADMLTALSDALRIEPTMRPNLGEFIEILESSWSGLTAPVQEAGAPIQEAPAPDLSALPENQAQLKPLMLSNQSLAHTLPWGQGGCLYVNTIQLSARDIREPVQLPFDLSGISPALSHPLALSVAGSVLELRVCARAFNARRAVRIYPEIMSAAARNTYTLLPNLDEVPLFIGHHRGPLHKIQVSTRARAMAGPSGLRAALSQLGIDVEAPAEACSLLTLWRSVPQRNEIYLLCVLVNDNYPDGGRR